MADVSDTNEVSDSVEAAQRNLEQQFGGSHVQKVEDDAAADAAAKAADEPLDPAVLEDGKLPQEDPASGLEGESDGEGGQPEESTEKKGTVGGLNKDWGLEILVSVGNTWIDSLLASDADV
eukprot:scaffold77068_cov20-Prasinocladus_malaysianus.AAC.1